MTRSFGEQVAALPDQLRIRPPRHGEPLPASGRLILGGMGGSAIAGEFLAARLAPRRDCVLVRDESLPAGTGPDALLLAISYSGNTRETLSLWREAGARGLRRGAVASGGALLEAARREGAPTVLVPPGWAPRTAFGYLLRAAWTLAAGDEDPGWEALAGHLASCGEAWTAPEGGADGLADRLARSLPVLLAAGPGPVAAAHRWAGMLAENAKTASSVWEFPEAGHNRVMALANRPGERPNLTLIDLGGPAEGPARERWQRLLAVLGRHGGAPETIPAPHPDPWFRDLGTAYLGDRLSLALAARLGVDPASLSIMDDIKRSLPAERDTQTP